MFQAAGVDDQVERSCLRQQSLGQRMVQVANYVGPFVVTVVQRDGFAEAHQLEQRCVLNKIEPSKIGFERNPRLARGGSQTALAQPPDDFYFRPPHVLFADDKNTSAD